MKRKPSIYGDIISGNLKKNSSNDNSNNKSETQQIKVEMFCINSNITKNYDWRTYNKVRETNPLSTVQM